ncbi:MAG: glycosyltransferase, partial [Candidatus Glassbacteria bacterium]|nr:glycosyltransferase [Candidatus Glassbacteria bacterium]
MTGLDDYADIVGEKVIADLFRKARKLYGKHVLHINSTYQGGGVAVLLSSMIPLMNDMGVDTGWRILHGNPDFFAITKKFHNAILGNEINLSEIKKRLYAKANEEFSRFTHIEHDVVVIHDPQPLPLIKFYRKKQPWFWRCHIDLSAPNPGLWEYLKKFIIRYDVVVVSNEKYIRKDLPVDWRVICPAINPLAPKNMEIPEKLIEKYLRKFGVPTDKPLITQVSRFDKLKDPEGVVDVFKLVRQQVDARLVLCGSMAADDPEGAMVYERISRKARKLIEQKDLILINVENDILVNALQRNSSVIVQKSLMEGFGLTVAEALWKETPVVAS